jgi:Catalytic LigB subunit of aromatic ring-opening dioxygenase
MASVVGAIGLPHTPVYPSVVAREGAESVLGALYRKAAEALRSLRPDVLLLISCDHFNTFFLDNYPVLAIGIGNTAHGPNDYTPMPPYAVKLASGLATHARGSAIADGFDVALVQDFGLDHAFMVPLHFMTPQMDVPIVPVFVNGLVPPLPSARRAHAFGQGLAKAVATLPAAMRVVAVGSGHFSLEVGGPRADPGDRSGVPDPGWVSEVHGLLECGDVETLMARGTGERMAQAGNIGGELLMWLTMLGALGAPGRPDWLEQQPEMGHCFAMWRA